MASQEILQLNSDFTDSEYANQAPQNFVQQDLPITAVTNINGASGPNVNFTSVQGFSFAPSGSDVIFSVSNAATARTALSAAKSGVNTDITQLNGASQVDVSSVYKVSGTQVVQARGAAVADAAGGATIDAEARTAINTLLARLRAHGLIAP